MSQLDDTFGLRMAEARFGSGAFHALPDILPIPTALSLGFLTLPMEIGSELSSCAASKSTCGKTIGGVVRLIWIRCVFCVDGGNAVTYWFSLVRDIRYDNTYLFLILV